VVLERFEGPAVDPLAIDWRLAEASEVRCRGEGTRSKSRAERRVVVRDEGSTRFAFWGAGGGRAFVKNAIGLVGLPEQECQTGLRRIGSELTIIHVHRHFSVLIVLWGHRSEFSFLILDLRGCPFVRLLDDILKCFEAIRSPCDRVHRNSRLLADSWIVSTKRDMRLQDIATTTANAALPCRRWHRGLLGNSRLAVGKSTTRVFARDLWRSIPDFWLPVHTRPRL
jgi:hypothetical protein